MKMSVAPEHSVRLGLSLPRLSRTLVTVVPTAVRLGAELIFCAVVWESEYFSECISWSRMLSALTGLNVPTPTWRVRKSWLSLASISGVKWRPAVGAAMAPSSRAKVVW